MSGVHISQILYISHFQSLELFTAYVIIIFILTCLFHRPQNGRDVEQITFSVNIFKSIEMPGKLHQCKLPLHSLFRFYSPLLFSSSLFSPLLSSLGICSPLFSFASRLPLYLPSKSPSSVLAIYSATAQSISHSKWTCVDCNLSFMLQRDFSSHSLSLSPYISPFRFLCTPPLCNWSFLMTHQNDSLSLVSLWLSLSRSFLSSPELFFHDPPINFYSFLLLSTTKPLYWLIENEN